jgi:hypothetical protein
MEWECDKCGLTIEPNVNTCEICGQERKFQRPLKKQKILQVEEKKWNGFDVTKETYDILEEIKNS